MVAFKQDSAFDRAVVMCEAVLSGECSEQVLKAAKAALMDLPANIRQMAARTAVNRGNPRRNNGKHHDRVSIRCALSWL